MKFKKFIFSAFLFVSVISAAQQVAPPTPQRIDIHSKILNEDRAIWVRTPPGYEQSKTTYPVVYQTDAPEHVNEIGSSIDFLVANDRMPALIVVGIGNTDRTRDLTPSRAKVESYPTSGGGDKFLEFIQSELIPEIEKRYRTAPYRIFAGHSFGGLLAIHALITRPDLFNAYIAVSPSLQWDDGRALHEAQQFFAKHGELKKTLFFSLANEADKPNPMGENFEALRKTLEAGAPKGLRWTSARYPDEDHRSTVLLAHYAGMRTIFSGWNVVVDARTGLYGGGLTGIEQHYRELSERFGYPIVVPEMTINILGYQLLSLKRVPEAVAAFERYAQLYPESANAYDSLGEGLEAAGKLEGAAQNFKKAIELGTKSNDESLPQFQQHLERVAKAAQAAEHPAGKN